MQRMRRIFVPHFVPCSLVAPLKDYYQNVPFRNLALTSVFSEIRKRHSLFLTFLFFKNKLVLRVQHVTYNVAQAELG